MADQTLDLGALDEQRARAGADAPGATDDGQRWSVDRVLFLAAVVMVPGGIAAILLGWYGAARTPFLFEQVPYLISGGLLGVALTAGGGLLYLGSWVSRLAAQQREDSAQLRALLTELRTAEPEPSQASEARWRPEPDLAVVATPTGTMFHRPDCSVVAGRDDVRPVSAGTNGLRPCKLCDPLVA